MRKLSRWAKFHPIAARVIIVISRCLLLMIAWFLGKQVTLAGIGLSPLWLYFFILLFFVTGMLYPRRLTAATYMRRKVCDAVVCVSGFLMVLCLTAQLHQPFAVYQTVRATVPVGDSSFKNPEVQRLLQQYKDGEKTSFSRKEKRLIRKEFNHQLIRYGTATITGQKEAQRNAGVIILACIVAVGLMYLVLALACTLSCNGSDAAAVVVGVLGTAAIVWGLVAVIKSTRRKKEPSAESRSN